MSAKGITKDARKRMTHEIFKDVLEKGDFVRLINTRIASSNHRIHTLVVNKKSLSGYDDKRYICWDKVSTLPYGHYSLHDEMFGKLMLDDEDWGESNTETVASQNNQEMASPWRTPLPSIPMDNSWTVPDPGFFQRQYSETELNQDLVDFDKLSETEEDDEPMRNPFVLDEAEESNDEKCTPVPNERVQGPSGRVVLRDTNNVAPRKIRKRPGEKRKTKTARKLTFDSDDDKENIPTRRKRAFILESSDDEN